MFICFLIFASVGHFALDRSNPQNSEHAGIALICFASFFIFGMYTCSRSSLPYLSSHQVIMTYPSSLLTYLPSLHSTRLYFW